MLSILMAICFFPAFAQNETVTETAEESQPDGTTLKELVVEGKNAWFEGNKAIFVPDKNEKKLAKDAPSLIDNTGTPLLYTEGGQIKSRIGGKNVQIFINGVRADDNDLKTLWPMNAIRVEYIQNPDDPRFEGVSNVVNFIMNEYTYGGLTSVDAYQRMPNVGIYSFASKFVYKKMTYSASAEGRYSRDHISGEYEQEDFSDV